MFEEIAKLHRACFPAKPWTAAEFADLKKSGCDIIISQNGFIVWRQTLDEAEIITIGVAPAARRGGIAAAMLGLVENDVKKRAGKKIFLEVAETNAPARALYKSAGYAEIGRRRGYYDGVDAILMTKELS